MSYLETKRNAIMNAIQSGQITNLLANCTWLDGYFGGGGAINTPTGSKEKYTDEYIEIEPSKDYLFIMTDNSTSSKWARFCLYNSSKAYSSLLTYTADNYRAKTYMVTIGTTTTSVAYLRLSLRTFGNINVALVDQDEVMQWLDSKITYENVTAQ